jgi:hypothetical protein
MEASHETAAGRRANRSAGIKLGEPHTRPCEAVDIGRPYFLLAIASNVSIAKVIGKYDNDIGLLILLRSHRNCGSQAQEQDYALKVYPVFQEPGHVILPI